MSRNKKQIIRFLTSKRSASTSTVFKNSQECGKEKRGTGGKTFLRNFFPILSPPQKNPCSSNINKR